MLDGFVDEAGQRADSKAQRFSENPTSLQLRFLQTLTEVAAEKNSTIVFPVPIDMIEAFMKSTRL